MELTCQYETIKQLQNFSTSDSKSIIIHGTQSSGKTYLAKKYADMLSIPDFYLIVPKVNDLREAIDESTRIRTPVVLCIENLDTGVFAASSVMLKFLEEPASNIHIVVTARNIDQIQDTIISRSLVTSIGIPTKGDLITYAETNYFDEYQLYRNRDLWNCLKTFEDVDTMLKLDAASIQYIENLAVNYRSSACISDLVWSLQKFPEKGDTPVNLVIRYIIYKLPHLLQPGIDCIRMLEQKRIASYAILTKFAFEMKR